MKSRLSRFSQKVFLGKNIFTSLIAIIAIASSSVAQSTWTQKADFGGGTRSSAVGFCIGSKGFIGTGYFYANYSKDFWEYDPETNTWTQKADFGGSARTGATGFSIGSKGYIGTGYEGFPVYSSYKDFWEYDPLLNTWTQKADFGGSARSSATGFNIDGKGYIGTGSDGVTYKNDFWEYNPDANSWEQKADFGGGDRNRATGFSIGTKGYIGTGSDGSNSKKDFWEYDPDANSWEQKADFGGNERYDATGLSMGMKGYIGIGFSNIFPVMYKYDFWEYDPTVNIWFQKANFGGEARSNAVGFSIGNKGYLGTGESHDDWNTYRYEDFWEYTPEGVVVCNNPSSLSTVNINTTTAKLNWNTVGVSTGYKVRYKIASTSEWITLPSTDNDKTLSGLAASTEYAWQVKSVCSTQPIVSSEWSEKQFFTTDALRLTAVHETMLEVYPNPVSQFATVSFSLNEGSLVVIEIMDVNGRSLRVLADENFSEGSHEVTFHRESLSAGIYFLQVKTNQEVMLKKMVID